MPMCQISFLKLGERARTLGKMCVSLCFLNNFRVANLLAIQGYPLFMHESWIPEEDCHVSVTLQYYTDRQALHQHKNRIHRFS